MYVLDHTCLAHEEAAGCRAARVAGRTFGIRSFEMWSVTVDPGSAFARAFVAGEQLVVAYGGGGVLAIDGAKQKLRAPCSVRIPLAARWKLVNPTDEPLRLVIAHPMPQ